MNKKGVKSGNVIAVTVVILLMCLLTGCGSGSGKAAALKVEITAKMDYWELMDLSDTDISSREECEKLVEDYLVRIGEVLNCKEWWMDTNADADTFVLNVDISENTSRSFNSGRAQSLGGSQVGSGVTLAVGHYKDGGLAHELTHIIGIGYSDEFSIGLAEGLCEYAQTEVGDVGYNKEWDFQDYMSVLIKSEIEFEEGRDMIYEILEHVGSSEKGCPYGQSYKMFIWYNMNHSFVRYLIDIYGMDTVKDFILYGNNEDSYDEYFDKSYVELKDEWLSYILSYDNQITIQDIREYVAGKQ